MKILFYFLLFSISIFGQEKNTPKYFPFHDTCTNESKYRECEREIFEREILNLVTPEIEQEIISNLKNGKAVLVFAFAFEDNKPIREDIDIDFSNNDLKEKLRNFLLELKPLPKNNSYDDTMNVRHFEFVFLTNKSKKKLVIADEKKLKEIKHKHELKFGTSPYPINCQNFIELENCVNQFMNNHIKNNFRYPEDAMDIGIQGKVMCHFIIDKNGYVQIEKLDGPHVILEKEAERILKRLPKFQHGTIKGIPAKFSFTIPITFKLD